jgi:hypothetical protein
VPFRREGGLYRLHAAYSSTDIHSECFFIFHLLHAPPMIFHVGATLLW